jgi:hypothetical protein
LKPQYHKKKKKRKEKKKEKLLPYTVFQSGEKDNSERLLR